MNISCNTNVEMIIIGGSAGSLPVLLELLKALPPQFSIPVVIVIHRQRNVISELSKILATAIPNMKFIEPDDKEEIRSSSVYITPQNYHLLIEKDKSFSLDYSELEQFSRPSINVTFESAALVYEDRLLAVLLTGANADGTAGLVSVVRHGGVAIAQDPSTAQYPVMPLSAIQNVKQILVLSPEKIGAYLRTCNL